MLIDFSILYILGKLNKDQEIPCHYLAYLKLFCVLYWIEVAFKLCAVALLLFHKISVLQYMNNDIRYLFLYLFVNILNFGSFVTLSNIAFKEKAFITEPERLALLGMFSLITVGDGVVYAIALYFEKQQVGMLKTQVGVVQTVYNTGKDLLNAFLNPAAPVKK
jgi:hypothetical protein